MAFSACSPRGRGALVATAPLSAALLVLALLLLLQPPTARSAPANPLPDACARWAVYAACSDDTNPCRSDALDLSGTDQIITGALHSNSGLRIFGSSFLQSPHWAEWGLSGRCSDNNLGVCPPGGYAVQVPTQKLPELYHYEDFLPGGRWWNEQCQGEWAGRCHFLPDTDLRSNDTISSGLWVVHSVHNVGLWPGTPANFTFVTTGDFAYTGSDLAVWEPFVGSSTMGGSGLFLMSTAADPGGVSLTGAPYFVWSGLIYVPHGVANLSAPSTLAGRGSVFAWRASLSGGTLWLMPGAEYCPPPAPARP